VLRAGRRNKPLKDIAWGLAGRGVAVLRAEAVADQEHTAGVDSRPELKQVDGGDGMRQVLVGEREAVVADIADWISTIT
jgi:hypothetical protein